MISILTDINRTHTAELREAGSRRRLARRAARARAAALRRRRRPAERAGTAREPRAPLLGTPYPRRPTTLRPSRSGGRRR